MVTRMEKGRCGPDRDASSIRTEPVRVLIADAQRLFAESLAIALRLSSFDVVDEYPSTGLDAAKLIVQERPDIALIDYWMADMDGPATTRAIHAWAPGTTERQGADAACLQPRARCRSGSVVARRHSNKVAL